MVSPEARATTSKGRKKRNRQELINCFFVTAHTLLLLAEAVFGRLGLQRGVIRACTRIHAREEIGLCIV